MAKKVFEITFGTRFQNAQNLVDTLQSFATYTPVRSEDSISEIAKLLDEIKQVNANEATYLQTYTLAVDARQKVFYNDDASLRDKVTSIMATIRAQYGKASKEVSSLTELANKIRGISKKKPSDKADTKQVSSSQQSYASIVQNFADLVASLEALSPAYNAINPSITIVELKKFLDLARDSSQKVNVAYTQLTNTRQKRDDLYKELSVRTQRIKEGIKALYGTKSQEYESIKGLKI